MKQFKETKPSKTLLNNQLHGQLFKEFGKLASTKSGHFYREMMPCQTCVRHPCQCIFTINMDLHAMSMQVYTQCAKQTRGFYILTEVIQCKIYGG